MPDSSSSGVALLLIDVINHLEFDAGERLLPHALVAADAIVHLRDQARAHGVPVIYVNDNFGRWQSDFEALVAYCLHNDVPGRPLVERLQPRDDHYFVLKPRHSAFFNTALETLLDHLQARTLILTGFTGDMCVLMTAMDAYMRDYRLVVPADAVASEDVADNEHALAYMARVFEADIRPSADLAFQELAESRV